MGAMMRGVALAGVLAGFAVVSASGWAAQPAGGAQPAVAVKPVRSASARAARPGAVAAPSAPGPVASPSPLDFQIASWFSVEAPGSHLIRHDAVGKALTEPATGEWEEITVFAHKKNRNRELAYERAHAADVGVEAAGLDAASPTIKPPGGLDLFDLKF